LVTNTNFGVSFSVTGGADKNKFAISSDGDEQMLFFRRTDFEAREDHTYSVEITARHKSDTLVIVKSNKTIDIGGGIVDLDIGRSFIV
jgi:hypothetical protein